MTWSGSRPDPQAIEEILRWEPPALQLARYVTRDVEYFLVRPCRRVRRCCC